MMKIFVMRARLLQSLGSAAVAADVLLGYHIVRSSRICAFLLSENLINYSPKYPPSIHEMISFKIL
ncbi:MAG: hypothetical protein EGR87_08175 [Sutterella wadsworthensis]|nr:hypothetical protein [Sutterella wadsworthensis]